MEAYALSLSGATRYGLNIATQAALRGGHGSTFFPSPIEFRRLYDAAMQPVFNQREAERRQIERDDDDRRALAAQATRTGRTQAEIASDFAARPGSAEYVLRDAPIGRRIQRMKANNKGRKVLATGVSLEQFRSGALAHKWGNGARYVPILETVFSA